MKKKFGNIMVLLGFILIFVLSGLVKETYAQASKDELKKASRIAARNTDIELWGKLMDQYEYYGMGDVDRLLFKVIEKYIDAEIDSRDERLYMNMAFNFIVNKHLRLKKAEWKLKGIEFDMKLLRSEEHTS